ncbi:hypothetical protein CRG98_008705 [Punica granatum]|uniref:Uncharacterized protein n=1 Tax=Punica granatum TaxID=22663 RepID=A0A2I0KRH8_PUNGR|nr:hypothetical protein CRG98_008705 [Punica granatum]
MRAELQSIREERERLCCELVDSRAKVADYRELQTESTRARARVAHLDREMARLSATLDRVHARVIATGVTPIPNSSTCQDGRRGPRRYLRGSQSTGPGTFSAAPDVCSTTSDSRGRTSGVFRRPFDASCQHPILAHRLRTRESPNKARVPIHHPTIRGEHTGTET